jgi:hypothetical protein
MEPEIGRRSASAIFGIMQLFGDRSFERLINLFADVCLNETRIFHFQNGNGVESKSAIVFDNAPSRVRRSYGLQLAMVLVLKIIGASDFS